MSNTYSLDLELSSSQHAFVADNADVSITGDITIEAWIKLEQLPSTAATFMFIVGKFDASDNKREYYLGIDTNDKLNFWFDADGLAGNNSSFLTDSAALVAGDVGVWRHIVVSADVSVPSAIFYKDLVVQADTASVTASTAIHNGVAAFKIGAYKTTAESFLDGKICYVRLWNDIRTPTELTANWKKSLVGNETGLVGNWKFNNDATDSAKSSDLTLSGSPVYSLDVPFTTAFMKPNKYW